MGALSFDSMLIQNKVKYMHSHKLVGFPEGALQEDVLLQELDGLDASAEDNKNERPTLSQ